MTMVKCEACGSTDIRYTDDGFFQCAHCGVKYTKNQFQKQFTDTVQVTVGEAERERKLKNVRTFCSLKQYDKAIQVCRELTDDFPDRKEVWKAYAECVAEYMTENNKLLFCRIGYGTDAERAFKTGARIEPSCKEIGTKAYKTVAERVLNGKCSLSKCLPDCYTDELYERYKSRKQFEAELRSASPELEVLIKKGEELAADLRKNELTVCGNYILNQYKKGYYYTLFSHKTGDYVYTPVWCLSDFVLFVHSDNPEDDFNTQYSVMNTRILNDDDVERLFYRAAEEWNTLPICPYCQSNKIHKKLLSKDRVCDNCGMTIIKFTIH